MVFLQKIKIAQAASCKLAGWKEGDAAGEVRIPLNENLFVLFCIVTAALGAMLLCALLGIRTADAGFAAFFGFIQVQYNAADDTQKNCDKY